MRTLLPSRVRPVRLPICGRCTIAIGCTAMLLLAVAPLPAQSFERQMINSDIRLNQEGTLALGDLNADGEIDMIYMDQNGTLAWIANRWKASQSFDSPVVIDAAAGSRGRIRCADFDGDADLDLAVASSSTCRILLYENRLSEAQQDLAPPRQIGDMLCKPDTLSAVDLDRDGRIDLVAGFSNTQNKPQFNGILGWFRNQTEAGAISFSALLTIQTNMRNIRDMLAYDANFDQSPDLVVCGYESLSTGSVSPQYFERTTGSLQLFYAASHAQPAVFTAPPVLMDQVSGDNYIGALALDVNSDYMPDLISLNYRLSYYAVNHQTLYTQTTKVNLQVMQTPALQLTAKAEKDEASNYAGPQWPAIAFQTPRDLHAADMDGDGIEDLVCNFPFAWFRNDGAQGLTRNMVDPAPFFFAAADAIPADIDGDGMIDVVVVEDFGTPLTWWRNALPRQAAAMPGWMFVP